MKKNLVLFILSAMVFLLSCNKEESNEPTNNAPVIESVSASPSTIMVNKITTLSCIATDTDGNELTFIWTSQLGEFPDGNTKTTVQWKAPDTPGSYAIIITVSDGKETEKDVVIVTVIQSIPVPAVPTLISPSNESTEVGIPSAIVWNTSFGADSYTLQISIDSLFNSYVFNQSGLTDTSKQVSGLSESTQFFWRVSATNSAGTSEWSSVWNFTTASLGGGAPCPGTTTVTYLGKTYNTVQIGNQCWLRENLNVGTMINSINGSDDQTNNGILEKYCYDNFEANCNTYGGLYQWNEAMQYSTAEGTQGICPSGWHIPTLSEFQILSNAIGGDGNSIKAIGQGTGEGAGTNISGFSALLAGYRDLNNGGFFDVGIYAYFWSSTNGNSDGALNMYLYYNFNDVYLYGYYKDYGFSVRCVQD